MNIGWPVSRTAAPPLKSRPIIMKYPPTSRPATAAITRIR